MPGTQRTTKAVRKPETKRRYTVELTAEGWQIKDNELGIILVDVFGDRLTAENKTERRCGLRPRQLDLTIHSNTVE